MKKGMTKRATAKFLKLFGTPIEAALKPVFEKWFETELPIVVNRLVDERMKHNQEKEK